MDITCPELELVDQTSDYGSKDNSENEDIEIKGFCSIFSHLDGKGEI